MRRLIGLILACLALGCADRRARGGTPTVDVTPPNSHVLEADGRCTVPIDTAMFVLERRVARPREKDLARAIVRFERTPAADRVARVARARVVRRAFVRWHRDVFDAGMRITRGPYRCVARGPVPVVRSSDPVVEKRARFAAYVSTLDGILAREAR